MSNVGRFSVTVQDKKSTSLIVKWIEEMHKLYNQTHSPIWKTNEDYNTYYLVALVASCVLLFVIMALAILLIHKIAKTYRTRSYNLRSDASHRRSTIPVNTMSKYKNAGIPPDNVVAVYDKKEIPESINEDVTAVNKKDEGKKTPSDFAVELEKTLGFLHEITQ